jgi:hypothetical protein
MKTGTAFPDLLTEVERRVREVDGRSPIEDLVAPSSHLSTHSNGVTLLRVGEREFPMQETAQDQLATFLGIPRDYYRRLREGYPGLLDENTNTLLADQKRSRMIRTLDGSVRAILSDTYRRLDIYPMLQSILPTLTGSDLQLESCELTERRLYLKLTTPRLRGEVRVGETVQFGVVLFNSEVGFAQLGADLFSKTLSCLNGATHTDWAGSGFRRRHYGVRLGGDEEAGYSIISERTQRIEDRAIFSALADSVEALLDREHFEELMARYRAAASRSLPRGLEGQTVRVLSNRYGLTEEEHQGVLSNLINSGDPTWWGAASAITAMSQNVESYDRASALEVVGGRVLTMQEAMWAEIESAAKTVRDEPRRRPARDLDYLDV